MLPSLSLLLRTKRRRKGGLKLVRISEVGLLGGSRTRTRFDRGSAEVRGFRTSTEGRGLKGKAILRTGHGERRRTKGVDLEGPEEEDRTRTTALLLLPPLDLNQGSPGSVKGEVGRRTRRSSFSGLSC